MPIYEYSCGECDRAFEELIIRRSDEAEVKCPACGKMEMEQIMQTPEGEVRP